MSEFSGESTNDHKYGPCSRMARLLCGRHSKLNRLVVAAHNRLVWSWWGTAVRRLAVAFAALATSPRHGSWLALAMALSFFVTMIVGSILSLNASVLWTVRHASCFRGETDRLNWTIPPTVPRLCSSPDQDHPAPALDQHIITNHNVNKNLTWILPHQICLTSLSDGASTRDDWSTFWEVPLWQRLTRCRNFDAIGGLLRDNHVRYTDRHGYQYTYREKPVDPTRPPAWSKIRAVQEELMTPGRGCEWVMWLDADAVIMNSTIPVESLLRLAEPDADLIVTPDRRFGVSSGVWLIKNSDWSKRFLEEWWNMRSFVRAKGLTLSGDNEAFGHLVNQTLQSQDDGERRRIRVIPRCSMNSLGWFVNENDVGTDVMNIQASMDIYHTGDFVAHAAGVDNKLLAVRYLVDRAQ
jgi:galactosyl transferase GMA12/MNN10 family